MLQQVKFLFSFSVLILLSACSSENKELVKEATEIGILGDEWLGQAIAYSGYRNNHDPRKEIFPTKEEVLEDLRILEKNWGIIRIYGADKHSADVLEVIEENNIQLKVMLGIWLGGEPEYFGENAAQIKYGIELANKFKSLVIAVNVGNETQFLQSDHKVENLKLISYITEVKANVNVPVTTADTWSYWVETDKSSQLIEAVDFIAVHIYPIWGNIDIDGGINVTKKDYTTLTEKIPHKKIIITEAGWATYTVGDMHVPEAGDELKQDQYYKELMEWSKENKVTVFWFEAFDEPWKGNGTEGYWGLFTEGRKAKKSMHELYPGLITDEPTSPSYK